MCTRPVKGFPFVGKHAYLWDDNSKKGCGMRSSSGKGPTTGGVDTGPGTPGQNCSRVPGSDGKEGAVMSCCQKNANKGIWFPGINDCHNSADDCLKSNGLAPPPHPRFDPPGEEPPLAHYGP